MSLIDIIGMECVNMKWDTNQVIKAQKQKKSEFALIANALLPLKKLVGARRFELPTP